MGKARPMKHICITCGGPCHNKQCMKCFCSDTNSPSSRFHHRDYMRRKRMLMEE